jgi:hypothetical protein
MKRLCQLALTTAIIAFATGQMWGGDSPAAPELNPKEAFQQACERLVTLESKHELLKGVSKVKPSMERDEKERLKSARFAFAGNAVPPGKEAAKAKDDGKPFFYVTVEVWSGRTPSPPGDLHEFRWKGQTYQMWVRVYGSDAAVVKAVQKTVDEPLLRHFAPKK